MSQTAHNVKTEGLVREVSGALEFRIFRAMILSVIAAVIISAALAPWRFTAGLILGGGLSLLNYHWLQSSITAIFDTNATAQRPRAQSWRYVFRYLVVGIMVFASYRLRIVSLPATIAGLCSFVPALFVEAFRQFYFVIIHREESY
jgi:hypothetical protein